jgi:hypothetical protein
VTRREIHLFGWLYAFLSFLELRPKLAVTAAWFDGTLERQHAALLAFQYANNEQSRVLQYAVPEFLVRTLGVTVQHAYMLQRWAFVAVAFILFHAYVRRWFSRELAFAAVCLLAATLPFSFMNDLQESFALLLATTVAALWAIRDGSSSVVAAVLLFGALNNETILALVSIYFVDRLRASSLWQAAWRTVAVAAPAFIYTGWIRYVTRDRPHLGGARHWGDNVHGILSDLQQNPLDYPRAVYLSMFFIFNVLWIFALLRLSDKPRFVRATLILIPAFLIPHMLTGIIYEVRQMVPLAFVVIPAAFFWIFREAE